MRRAVFPSPGPPPMTIKPSRPVEQLSKAATSFSRPTNAAAPFASEDGKYIANKSATSTPKARAKPSIVRAEGNL